MQAATGRQKSYAIRASESRMVVSKSGGRVYAKGLRPVERRPIRGIHVDDKLQFVEEPVEIMEREIQTN
ncbi:hypothetical protein Tco_0469297 [Tanacetum coccineum]